MKEIVHAAYEGNNSTSNIDVSWIVDIAIKIVFDVFYAFTPVSSSLKTSFTSFTILHEYGTGLTNYNVVYFCIFAINQWRTE